MVEHADPGSIFPQGMLAHSALGDAYVYVWLAEFYEQFYTDVVSCDGVLGNEAKVVLQNLAGCKPRQEIRKSYAV